MQKDMTGYDNGYFKVISFLESRRNSSGQMKRFWNCLCRCGNTKILYTREITRRVPSHCGCKYKRSYTHLLYKTWRNIKSRCLNKNVRSYKQYGAKGITICDEWMNDPESFISWSFSVGWQEGLVIDRIDNKKNYEPSNCRFITAEENNKKVYIDNPDFNRGSSCHFAKLNEQQVIEIKHMINNKIQLKIIAQIYNLNRHVIGNIKSGKTWKHVKI